MSILQRYRKTRILAWVLAASSIVLTMALIVAIALGI
jgi:hypothetical protein